MARPGPDGRSSHPLYATWQSIKTRCYNPNSRGFRYYGARGVRMHPEWVNNARAFLDWVDSNLGPRPDGTTLDRIDNDGDYAPGNLRWASIAEQRKNRRGWSKSGVRGVSRYQETRWTARITRSGKSHHLGIFESREEAAAAYEEARKRLDGADDETENCPSCGAPRADAGVAGSVCAECGHVEPEPTSD